MVGINWIAPSKSISKNNFVAKITNGSSVVISCMTSGIDNVVLPFEKNCGTNIISY